ncbi:geranylgeranyl diphosphate synthase type II [Dysgonomonas sp. PH5-45]|uniref:polyprenyl synthetase family protein n=1 Tax=unclassified Dysgonomonas TaxID=2630389 RepID=UPI002475EA99|nr:MULTISPECIES: polyprenyl synthetase family protein [unclassified Dysgonomonas]MDH6356048.1 geranylgeranyl diphosphate synthase type II [Dysgonomonas sp. PH5-45]MDH6388942.1 geranylgeranyl diphosphate synthase type II [Dysgonomonas sp. PH5-37]
MLYTFAEVLDIVNKHIEEIKFREKPQSLFDPISYILALGGKRVRPVLTLMGYNLYKDDIREAIPAALALEIFHNFTLLHDDLMDNADMRRGKETVHIKWNDNTAVLSGDAMLIEAYKEIAKTRTDVLPQVLALFSKTATEICCGQQYDMEFESRMDVSVDEYIEMIRLKTAVLLGGGLKMGAIIASAPQADTEALYDFGINIGLAFQLKDDLLDVYGNTAEFGKRIGGDILCNKKTFLLINVLQNTEAKAKLLPWIEEKQYNEEEKIKAVTQIYDSLNLKEKSEELILDYYNKAIKCLDRVSIPEEQKGELQKLATTLISRKS